MAILSEEATTTTTVAVFTGVFISVFAVSRWLQPKSKAHPERRYPPQVRSVPIIGSVPFLPPRHKWHTEFLKMSKTMGNVFAAYFGDQYTIVLNGRETIHEALVKKSVEFAGRPKLPLTELFFNPNFKGIIDAEYSPQFKKYHQLSLNILKDFGFGQTVMEDRIHIEVDELIGHLRQLRGRNTYPCDVITLCVLNVIASITCGKRFELTDPKLTKLVHSVQHFVGDFIEVAPLTLFPQMRHIPKFRRSIEKVHGYQKHILDTVQEMIDDTEARRASTSFISQFIQAEGKDYDKEELLHIMRDLLLAGTETSENTLQWAFILMANHQQIQKRIQKDLDEVVPRDRLPSLTDKLQLPYIEAAICEIFRRHTLVPMGVPRSATCDTEVGGYFVAAGTAVWYNLWGCHMDPEVWGDPEVYRPERFLDETGKVVGKDRVVSFSIGKRSCLGELLARQELYLFFTGILQNFDILPPEGHDKCDYTESNALTSEPRDYQIRFVPRSTN